MTGPVSVMHEEVHQRAGQEQQIRKSPQQMHPVLGPQKEQRDA